MQLNSKTVKLTQLKLGNILVPRLSSKWEALGIQLNINITADQFEKIRNKEHGEDSCLKLVLMLWEDNDTDDKPYTWATLLDVLRSEEMNEGELASELEQRFMPQHT